MVIFCRLFRRIIFVCAFFNQLSQVSAAPAFSEETLLSRLQWPYSRQLFRGNSIDQLVVNKVDATDVPGILRSKPNDGAVLMIQPFLLLMAMGQLQPFFSPHSLYLLVISYPAFNTKELGNLTITIPAILFGEPHHRQT